MSLAKKLSRRFTYADACCWPEEERWELIDGDAWDMSPAPNPLHQEVSGRLFYRLYGHLRGHGCRVFAAPIDLLLPEADEADDAVETVVQPDLVVVCDGEKVRERYLYGPPDLVVEIVSPSTARRDEGIKRDRYEAAGVEEYWVIYPVEQVVHRYRSKAGRYGAAEVFGLEDGSFLSSRFPELEVNLLELFDAEPVPRRQPE